MKAVIQELIFADHAAIYIVSNDWTKLQLLANQISSAIADWLLIFSVLKKNLKFMAQLVCSPTSALHVAKSANPNKVSPSIPDRNISIMAVLVVTCPMCGKSSTTCDISHHPCSNNLSLSMTPDDQ